MRKHWTYLCSWRNNCLTPSLYWGRNMAIAGQWPPHLIIKTISYLETRIGCFLFNPLHPTHHQTYPFAFLLHFVWNVNTCKNSLSLFCKLTFSTITFTMGENLTISWIIDSKPWLWSHKLRTKWFWHSRFFGLLQVVLFSSVFWQWVSGSCRYIFAKLCKEYRLYSVPLCSKQLFRLPPCDDRTWLPVYQS